MVLSSGSLKALGAALLLLLVSGSSAEFLSSGGASAAAPITALHFNSHWQCFVNNNAGVGPQLAPKCREGLYGEITSWLFGRTNGPIRIFVQWFQSSFKLNTDRYMHASFTRCTAAM